MAKDRWVTARYILLPTPGGGYILEHRQVWKDANGPIPPGGMIHHRNHDPKDNRLENLQLVTMGIHNTLHHLGAKRSPEVRAKLSAIAKGKPKSEETRRRMSLAAQRRFATEEGREHQRRARRLQLAR